MTAGIIKLTNGTDDRRTQIGATSDAALPKADLAFSPITESLGDATARVYGANTPANRERLQNANATMDGVIRVPR